MVRLSSTGGERRGSFRGTGRGEEHERKDCGVGASWEDKANQTVNNRGTAERNGSAGWCRGREGRKSEGEGGGKGGTTPRQLQNSPSFIVESHDSESPYIPRLLPFTTHPPLPSAPFLCPSLSFAVALSVFLFEPPLLPLFFTLPLSGLYLFLYRRSFLRRLPLYLRISPRR